MDEMLGEEEGRQRKLQYLDHLYLDMALFGFFCGVGEEQG